MSLFIFHDSETPGLVEVKRSGESRGSAVAVFRPGDILDLGRQLDQQIVLRRLTINERDCIITGVENGENIIATSPEDAAQAHKLEKEAEALAAERKRAAALPPPDRWSRYADGIETVTVIGEVMGNAGAALFTYGFKKARSAVCMWRRPMHEIVLPALRRMLNTPLIPRPWDGE